MINTVIFGVRLWVWLFFLVALGNTSAIIYVCFKDWFLKQYYLIRYPQKIFKAVIHYPNNLYKNYYRILCEEKYVFLDGGLYHINDNEIIKQSDFFVKEIGDNSYITIEGKKYNLYDEFKIKHRWTKISELHYFFGNPNPFSFKDYKEEKNKNIVNLSASQSKTFVKNQLFTKLFSLDDQNNLMKMLLIGLIILAVGVGYLIMKQQGFI